MRTPRTLTARLVVTVVVLVALVSALVVATSLVAMDRYLTARLDQQVRELAAPCRRPRPGGPGGPPDRGPGGDSYFGQSAGSVIMRTEDSTSQGLVITQAGGARELSTDRPRELERVPSDGGAHSVDLTAGGFRVMAGSDDEGNRWVAGLPTHEIQNTLRSLLLWSLLLALAGVVLAALLGSWLVRRQLRPLREVAATAHAVTLQPLSRGDPAIETRVPAPLHRPADRGRRCRSRLNTLLDHMSRHSLARDTAASNRSASSSLTPPTSCVRRWPRSTATPSSPVVRRTTRPPCRPHWPRWRQRPTGCPVSSRTCCCSPASTRAGRSTGPRWT